MAQQFLRFTFTALEVLLFRKQSMRQKAHRALILEQSDIHQEMATLTTCMRSSTAGTGIYTRQQESTFFHLQIRIYGGLQATSGTALQILQLPFQASCQDSQKTSFLQSSLSSKSLGLTTTRRLQELLTLLMICSHFRLLKTSISSLTRVERVCRQHTGSDEAEAPSFYRNM